MARTHLDEIVDFPQKVIDALSQNQQFVSLLINKPNADLTDSTVEDEYRECMFDYEYVEGVITEVKSFCCIDTEIELEPGGTIKDVYLRILVGVHKGAMNLNETGFKLYGNRRDNLIRELDYTLREEGDCGIGGFTPVDRIRPVTIAGKEFACKYALYRASSFGKGRVAR